VSTTSEFDLIARYFAPLTAGAPGAYNLSDDAATLSPSHGCELVITKDAVVAGVHFLPGDPPDLIGRKALRVNLSDLAGKGAQPLGFFMALMLPAHINDTWIESFANGLRLDVDDFSCPLLGGDTTSTPGPVAISITAIGEVKTGRMVRRNGARAGDVLCVSGTIGDAALGLEVASGGLTDLSNDDRVFLLGRYQLPTPRLTLGQAESARDSAAIDISDGLCADVNHICVQSGVGCVIQSTHVPLSLAGRRALENKPELIARLLTGGDDYELAFAVPPANVTAAQAHGQKLGIPVTPIGIFTAAPGLQVLDAYGHQVKLDVLGFTHR
jgi:thiamine-monophosphate kinase